MSAHPAAPPARPAAAPLAGPAAAPLAGSAPAAPGAASPLRAVLAAFQAGATSLDDIARRAGLPRDVVDAAVDHLVRVGRLSAKALTSGCPDAGCGSCASGTSAGTPGCGAPAPSARRSGPVLVALSLRRPT